MAGDVQQPFSLSFQVEALHSSSISFGRFELESLSWERRSSFSHNRYLDEVVKYAKPGSVTEKKEYFEAHFRKRALLRQASSVSQAEREGSNSDTSSYGTSTCEVNGDESPTRAEIGNVCQFDESSKGFPRDKDLRLVEYDPANDVDTSLNWPILAGDLCDREYDDSVTATEHVKCNNTLENLDFMFNIQQNLDLELESNDQTLDVLKEQCISRCTYEGMISQPSETMKAADRTRSSGLESRPDGDAPLACELEVRKEIAQSNSWMNKQTPLRATAPKQMPESIAPSLQSSPRQLKENPHSLNPKSPREKRSEKEVKPKRSVTPQPSPPERSKPRRHRSATTSSTTKQNASTRKANCQTVMNSSLGSSGGSQKNISVSYYELKIMSGNIRQLSGTPGLKEKQLCSTSNVVPRLSERKKLMQSQVDLSTRSSAKAPSRTSLPENRTTTVSKPCSSSRVKQAVSVNKFAGSFISTVAERGSNVRKIDLSRGIYKSHVMEANQRKEVDGREETESRRKQKVKENDHITKGRLNGVAQKGLGRSCHDFLRKSMGHSSGVGHHAVTIKAIPDGGPGRTDTTLLRKTMGH